MRSHTRASSAGSTQGQGSRSGSFVGGAGATRGFALDSDGSGAPSRHLRLVALSLAAALLALALFASSALASKELISDFGTSAGSGSFGGELSNPRDLAANETGAGPADAADVYVADEANNRIERFDSAGNFVSAWGKDTIASSVNERQRIVVEATAGTFTLSFDGSTTAPFRIGFQLRIESELAALPTVGSGNVSVSGSGTAAEPFIVTFKGALGGANQPTISANTGELSGTVAISTIVNGSPSVAHDTGTGFEKCTVATECQAGTSSGENGALDHPQSVAVDQDTGNVYVSDRGNRRIDEYDGEGNFIRSFGFDVAESGPGDTGTGYEVCNEAEGDACKPGVAGAGSGQYGAGTPEFDDKQAERFPIGFGLAVSPADGNATTGSVYLADTGNRRVDTYALDGTSPSSFGSPADFGPEQPHSVAVDARGIVYASDSNNNGDIQRYDSEDANGSGVGFLAPIVPPNDERQEITFTGFNSGDNFKLTCPNGTPTEELTYSASRSGTTIVGNGLRDACGAGNFSFSGEPPNVSVTFEGTLGAANQPQMTCIALSGSGSCSVTTTSEGHPGPLLTGNAASATAGLAVSPDGTALYVLRDPASGPTVVQQFGPTNEPGLTLPPTGVDDTHGATAGFGTVQGFGFDRMSGRLYLSVNHDPDGLGGPLPQAHRVYVFADSSSLPDPTASMSEVTAVTDRSATFEGEVEPNGGLVGCRFQYSTDGINWSDAGFAEGTGDIANHSATITHVTTSSGKFVVGELISTSGFPSKTTITAVGVGTLTLSNPFSETKANVALVASPRFPPACDSLSLNGGAQNVRQNVQGLVPGQEYFARLEVTRPYLSSSGPVDSTNIQSFTTASGPPVVSGVTARAVDEHSVRVSATIDPGHSPTSYVVQYGTTPSLGASTAPVQIGAGASLLEVAPVVAGLSPATQYYFKLVATNLAGSTASAGLAIATFSSPPSFGPCPNDRFRTGPSAKLPDCRAYEQATPIDKTGSDAWGGPSSVQASSAGDGITFYTFSGFPGGESFQEYNIFQSRFAGGEWSTVGLNPPTSYGDKGNVKAWTPDLRLSFATDLSLTTGGIGLVMRDNTEGSSTLLIPSTVGFGFQRNANGIGFALAGAFDDDSMVVFGARGNVPVTSGPAPKFTNAQNVYLYDRETGALTIAGLLPDAACGTPPCVPAKGSEVPAAFEGYVQEGHGVSPAGDVYFVDRSTKQIYLRRDVADPGATTVGVSASERTDCADHNPCTGTPEPDPAGSFAPTFMGATPDGSHAFFRSEEELTDTASTAPGTEDLYRYDIGAPAGQRLADLAPGAKAVGVLGYSDDGAYVYFVANGDLDGPGPAASGDCAGSAASVGEAFSHFSGSCSVYLWQADEAGACASAGGCVSFVARLDASEEEGGSDGFDWAGSSGGGSNDPRQMKASRVSANGRILVFRSQRRLTGYDNQGTSEFYRYEAESGQIACLTCDPTGAPPTGQPDLKNPDMYHAPASHATYLPQPIVSRNLSPDGNRFFFQSTDKLVPADVNGEASCSEKEIAQLGAGPSCRDVYEWEAPGTPGGSCTKGGPAYSSANGGCIYLLSTGTGAYPSYLADVSESGDTAFIFSRQQLLPFDEDTQEDIYAVKVDGGLGYQNAVRPVACEGDACRGASSRPSDAPGAGTSVFEGPGNPKSDTNATRCPKGKRTVHSKGKVRCVAKQAKHKNKRHHERAANNDRRATR